MKTALTTAVTPVIWGSTYLTTTQLLPPGRPVFDAAVRALPVGLVVVAATRRLPHGAWWWKAAVLGGLNIGVFFALLFATAYRLPGGVAATFGALQPLAVAMLGWGLLGERPTRWRIGWGLAGVLGVSLVVVRGAVALDGIGVLTGVGAALAMAAGMVLTKRWGRPVPLLAFTGWQLTAGGLLLVPVALLVEGAPPAVDLPAVAGFLWLAGAGTLLAYLLWFRGVERLPVVAVSFLGLLAPLVATVLGWLVLDQSLTATQLAGFVLAFAAVLAGQTARTARPAGSGGWLGRRAAGQYGYGGAESGGRAPGAPVGAARGGGRARAHDHVSVPVRGVQPGRPRGGPDA
jgi:probable blue pigment (indigoidine) exporter